MLPDSKVLPNETLMSEPSTTAAVVTVEPPRVLPAANVLSVAIVDPVFNSISSLTFTAAFVVVSAPTVLPDFNIVLAVVELPALMVISLSRIVEPTVVRSNDIFEPVL
jgi:hypothetical protein